MHLPVSPTNFIGRERERVAIGELVTRSSVRLVTLSGPGGIGKTRLAIETARQLRASFAGGIVYVDLSPLSEAEQVLPAMANELGARETVGQSVLHGIAAILRSRTLLLLDNFEHVADAASDVAAVLGATEQLTLLITSRVPLRISWEHDVSIPPLSLPPPLHDVGQADLDASEAMAMFVDRARAAQAGFMVTQANRPAIAEICRQLDGLPLAIELLAARTKLLPPPVLLARLDSPLDLLTTGMRDAPARHQTLRRSLEWSYGLLAPYEQEFFALQAVFVGRFTLDAVEAVAAADETTPVLDLVQAAIDHSLLQRDRTTDGETVFWMLHTVREYAGEHLAADPRAPTLLRRHAEYYLQLAERAEPELRSGAQLVWLRRLALEQDNLRAALDWLLAHDVSRGLRLAGALRLFWVVRGDLSEGRRWLSRGLSISVDLDAPIRAKALLAAADLAGEQKDFVEAIRLYEQSLELWEASGDQANAALVVNNLGNLYRARGDMTTAAALFERNRVLWHSLGNAEKEARALGNLGLVALSSGDNVAADELIAASLAIFSRLDDSLNIARGLNNRGYALLFQERFTEAQPILEASLARFRELGEKVGIANTLSNLATANRGAGRLGPATEHALESLQLFEELGDHNGIAECLQVLAAVAAARQQPERAVQLVAAAQRLRQSIGAQLPPNERTLLDGLSNRLRRAVGDKRFAAVWLLGETLSTADALLLARAQPATNDQAATAVTSPTFGSAQSGAAGSVGLSRREVEVLTLLARGLTYEQIADRLVISPRTVNRHLSSIYGKLNVETRHAAARWAIDQQLV